MPDNGAWFPDRVDLEKAIAAALAKGAEFSEVYLERRVLDSVRIEGQIVREASRGITVGAGVRAIVGEKMGYAYTDGLEPSSIIDAARIAGEIASQASRSEPAVLESLWTATPYSKISTYPVAIEAAKKIATAREADQAARAYDARISEVLVALVDEDKTTTVANSEGTYVTDRAVLTTLRVTAVAQAGSMRQRGFRSLSGRAGYEIFERESPKDIADDAARQAIRLLDAEEAPAGKMLVVLGAGRGGVLLHEAIGHGFEGDFIRKTTSLFAGRIGEPVAVPGCTIVDDATIPGMRGTINIDDEGTPGRRNVIVEDGILRGFLYDKLNARLMGTSSTGNGRRQSYRHEPVPRMTNTFMLGGTVPTEEIIASVAHGLYAKRIGGGQVDIASGNFVFEVVEGYMIDDGKVGPPVRGANLIGNGAEILKKIEMMGNDFEIDTGGGTCGKAGQGMPVSDGTPTLRISEITVGGTKS